MLNIKFIFWMAKKSEIFNDLKSSARTIAADDGESIRLLLPRNNLINRLEMSSKSPKESAVCLSSPRTSLALIPPRASHFASSNACLLIWEKNRLQAVYNFSEFQLHALTEFWTNACSDLRNSWRKYKMKSHFWIAFRRRLRWKSFSIVEGCIF